MIPIQTLYQRFVRVQTLARNLKKRLALKLTVQKAGDLSERFSIAALYLFFHWDIKIFTCCWVDGCYCTLNGCHGTNKCLKRLTFLTDSLFYHFVVGILLESPTNGLRFWGVGFFFLVLQTLFNS